MSSLKYTPAVCIVGDNYQIIYRTSSDGISYVEAGEKKYYETNAGFIPAFRRIHKIVIPQTELNEAGEYSLHFEECIDKKPYFPVKGPEEIYNFKFKSMNKKDDIKAFFVSDIHGKYDMAKGACLHFGDELDLFIAAGDIIDSSEKLEHIDAYLGFLSDVTHGEIPVISIRGNHDTRGYCAEDFVDYIGTDGAVNTYYTFSFGPIGGVALDVGEDKWDDHPEYGGFNIFEHFREAETEFIQKVKPLSDDCKYKIAICHMPIPTDNPPLDSPFRIEEEKLRIWTQELDRIGVSCLFAGHTHKIGVFEPNGENDRFPHDYPVVVAAEINTKKEERRFIGSALTFRNGRIYGEFINHEDQVVGKYEI
ncbi:MAG: metallophosphoesterase [Clostridia bacterium]|nr:metallophosphoesterase [Clostridia bacterium]